MSRAGLTPVSSLGQPRRGRRVRRSARASRRTDRAARRWSRSRSDRTRPSRSPPIRYICVFIVDHPLGPEWASSLVR